VQRSSSAQHVHGATSGCRYGFSNSVRADSSFSLPTASNIVSIATVAVIAMYIATLSTIIVNITAIIINNNLIANTIIE
jgi:hypothetical protein